MAETNAPAPAEPKTPEEGQTPASFSPPKEEWDNLKKVVESISQFVQRSEKRFGFIDRKLSGKKSAEGQPPVDNEQLQQGLEAARKISLAIAANPDYQKVIAGDKTLQKIIARDPLSVLDQTEFGSVEEAVSSFHDYMEGRVLDLPVAQPTAETPENPPQPSSVNPPGIPVKTVEEKQEEDDSKLPVDERIAAKIARRVSVK